MMKNKKKGWIKWLIIGIAAVLVAGGAVLALMLPGAEKEEAVAGCDGKIYVNVDRSSYFGTEMLRYANDDGTYSMQLATDGEQLRVTVKDAETMRHIDSREIMGLSFDENGIVDAVVEIEDFTGGYAVKNVFAKAVNGYEVLCNGATDYNGYEKTITLNENTQVYQGCGAGVLTGTPTTVKADDELTAILDKQGNISHVFVLPYQEPGDIYWNITRMYDSTAAMTTREPDATGVYVYEMSLNGEPVTVKTRDMAMANALDKEAAKSYGLRFDENGYVSEIILAKNEVFGSYFASWHHITEVSGNTVTTLKIANGSDKGTSQTGILSRDCKIFDVSGASGPVGIQVDSVQEGDQIHGLKDCRGQICYIFIINRPVSDSLMYWNVNRNYNSTTKQTGRTPDKDGWYHILLTANGEQMTYKTQDKSLVTTIDARADKHFGLKLDGDVITAVYTPSQVTGGTFFASWYDVQEFTDRSVTAKRTIGGTSQGKVVSAPIAADCKIYNVSDIYQSHVGEETTLQIGDRIHGEMDVKGNLKYIYVVNRLVGGDLYWNVNRMWDGTNKVSTRKPNADGVYEILLAFGARQEVFYTTDPKIVHKIDAQADKHFGLEVHSGNRITKFYSSSSVTGGTYFASWYDVIKLGPEGISAQRTIGGANQGKVVSAPIAENCKIYNVSSQYVDFVGEPTTINIGDRIHGETDYKGELVYIYVVEKNVTFSNTKHTCTHVTEDVQWKEWNGVGGFKESGYYVLNRDVTVRGNRKVEDGLNVVLCLNGHTVSGNVALLTAGYNSTLTICDHKNEDGSWAGTMTTGFTGTAGGVFYGYDGSTINIYGGNYYHTATCKMAGIGGIGNKGAGATLNIYDGLFSGGSTTGNGGNFYIFAGATMNLYGGIIENGTSAAYGGNIVLDGNATFNMYGGTVRNGTATTNGGNLDLRKNTSTANLLGGSIEGGCAAHGGSINTQGAVNMSGGLVTGGYTTGTGGEGGNVRIGGSGVFTMTEGSVENGGVKDGAVVTKKGGNFQIFGTLNLKDGTIAGGQATNNGGNISTWGGKVNISGGTVKNGVSPTNGGNLMVDNGCVLTMTGGSVTGGSAKLGGGIYVNNGTTAVFDNVTITGNKKSDVGVDVYITTKTAVTLNGKLEIGNLFANSGIMELGPDGLDDSSAIGLYKVTAGPILNTPDEKDAGCFQLLKGNYQIVYENGQVSNVEPVPDHMHCLCGGNNSVHTGCDTKQGWTAWESSTSLPTDSGWYYLTGDVDLSDGAHINLTRGVRQHICLNGFTIKGPKNDTMWWVREYLSISDCQGSGRVIAQSTASGTMLHVFCNQKDSGPAGTFELYGGTLTATDKANGAAGILMVGNSGTNACYFNMYGGKITGGQATKEGGAIHLNTTGSVMNMYGGEISGNSSATNGGGIYASKGTFNMYGGTVKDNTATTNGGNIYVYSNGKGFIYDGLISGGSAAHGGSVNAQGAIIMEGGTITGGYTTGSSGEGGNVRVGGSGTFTLKGGTVENGGVLNGTTVTKKGGNIQVFGALVIEGGIITGGKSVTNGGNISMWGGTLTMTGGTVQNGVCGVNGGNIAIDNSATAAITGGIVTGGTCGGNGGGVWASANSTATITDGTVTGNKKSNGTDSDVYKA